MGLEQLVTVNISTVGGGITLAGFGVPLILSANAAFAERARVYTDLTGLGADFATTTPEYLAATAIFSQNPKVPKIIIGRRANKPTQKFHISVASVKNLTAYKIRFGAATFTYTSDSSATNDEIADGLAALITGVTGFTAATSGAGGSHVIDVTGNASGNWVACESLDVTLLLVTQTHVDPGLAADLDAIKSFNNDWYLILNLYNSLAEISGIAAWVETQEKDALLDSLDSDIITTAVGGTDIGSVLKTAARVRTEVGYHPATDSFFSEAWAGKVLPDDPGSETWAFKTLTGVPAVNSFTATQITNMEAKHVSYYTTIGGINITLNGDTPAGEFIDIVRGRDFLAATLRANVFSRLASSRKIPYTDPGVAIIENEVRAVLKTAVNQGLLSENPAPVVTVPKVADVSGADKSARILRNVNFTATLAGAIHKVVINGTITF